MSACSDSDHMGPRLRALFAACAPLHHSTTRHDYLCRRVTWSGARAKQTHLCYACLNIIIFVGVCFANHQREKLLFHTVFKIENPGKLPPPPSHHLQILKVQTLENFKCMHAKIFYRENAIVGNCIQILRCWDFSSTSFKLLLALQNFILQQHRLLISLRCAKYLKQINISFALNSMY